MKFSTRLLALVLALLALLAPDVKANTTRFDASLAEQTDSVADDSAPSLEGVQLAVRAGFPGRMGPPAIVSEAVVYAPESEAIFAAFATTPTEVRKGLINYAVTSLKTAGVWEKITALQVYAAADSQAALVDWKVPSRVANAVNSPTFTADRGFAGDGSTSYIDTQYTPQPDWTGTGNFAGIRINGNAATEASGNSLGHSRFVINPSSNGTTANLVNANSTGDTHGYTVTGKRWYAMRRTNNTDFDFFIASSNSGAAKVNKVRAGGNNPSERLFIGARNFGGNPGTFSARQHSVFFAGLSSMTDGDVDTLFSTLDAYMTAVGNTN